MDTFTLTLLIILAFTLLAGFLKRSISDKCLNHFNKSPVSLEKTTGKIIRGVLKVRSTGLELVYHRDIRKAKKKITSTNNQDSSGKPNEIDEEYPKFNETSYIYYKYEYPQIQAIVRFHGELNYEENKKREKQLEVIHHPSFFRQFWRKFINMLKILQNALGEIIDVSISQFQNKTKAARLVNAQQETLNNLKHELTESVGTIHDPILERYIGHKVIFELYRGNSKEKYSGIFKNYTSSFLEFMDVEYNTNPDEPPRKADMLVPQRLAVVRHFAEENKETVKWLKKIGFWIYK